MNQIKFFKNPKLLKIIIISMALLIPACAELNKSQAQSPNLELKNKLEIPNNFAGTPFYFGMGVHIEPFGKVQGRLSNLDYANPAFFNKHVESIKAVASLVRAYNGYLTIQTESPFTDQVIKTKSTIFSKLEKEGHEIGLHYHENVFLGNNSAQHPVEDWVKMMSEQRALILETGVTNVRYWSGGNLYEHILEAGHKAGLEIMGDYKNPKLQNSPKEIMGLSPWRPKGSPIDSTDLSLMVQHDSNANIIFLPSGLHLSEGYGGQDRVDSRGKGLAGELAYFDELTLSLNNSLKNASKNRINVFRLTIHPGEFQATGQDHNFPVLELWLDKVIKPLIDQNLIEWTSYSKIIGDYKLWEKANPNTNPREQSETQNPVNNKQAYISLPINIHDFRHPKESAELLNKLIDLYEKYNVKGDFYLTAPSLKAYEQHTPQFIEKLKNSKYIDISYHVRPPHAAYRDFGFSLEGLNPNKIKSTLEDYENYELDMATGKLNYDKLGGYSYVKSILGAIPVAVASPAENQEIKTIHYQVFKEMGAKVVVAYHEGKTKIDKPYKYTEGLLNRPSDFSITKAITADLNINNVWWNLLDSEHKDKVNPTNYLKNKLTNWNEDRAAFALLLIHENNFYYKGATPWAGIYYNDRQKTKPKQAPFNLNNTDWFIKRSQNEQGLILAAYEEFVVYVAKNHNVVTSLDIWELSNQP